MGATELLLQERAALCDTFDAVGADAPTLDAGWDASDLAAHLVVRETRPDAAAGIILPGPFAAHMKNVMNHVQEKLGFDGMIQKLRTGPPLFYRRGPLASANVSENWIHHEDLRRAHGDGPRPLDAELDKLFWQGLGLVGKINGRRVRGTGLELRTPDGRSRVVRDAPEKVAVVGDPGELVLFMSGRKEAAVVETEGTKEGIALVLAARFGL